jgi:putative hydrolase of the HAD superfamily
LQAECRFVYQIRTNMPHVKAVLFDLDDTLWPINPVIKRAEQVLYDWLSVHAPGVARQFTIESLRARRLAMLQEAPRYHLDLRALRHAGLTEAFSSTGEDLAKVDLAIAVFSEARNAVTPFADVVPVLARLRGLVALGSVSNGVADLEAIGLARYFNASVAAHSFGAAKPDPAIFHAACDALGVRPSEAIYVGDDPVIDVEGAQKAGLRAVWMRRAELEPARSLPAHIAPDAICTSLYELDQWLCDCMINSGTDSRSSLK